MYIYICTLCLVNRKHTHIYIYNVQYILYHISTSAEPRTPRQGLGHHPTPQLQGPCHRNTKVNTRIWWSSSWSLQGLLKHTQNGGGRLCPTSSKMTTVLWTKWVLNNYQAVGQFEAELHGSGLKPWQRSEDPKRVLTAVVSTHPKKYEWNGIIIPTGLFRTTFPA